MPKSWEDRTSLFVAYLVDAGFQSSSVKSYISAIKWTLINYADYDWQDNMVLLGSLTRACKLINDCVKTRLPITCSLLELILFEVGRQFGSKGQPYLEMLYKAVFTLGYYGMLRVCELTLTEAGHVIKASNVHLAMNKQKLLIYLYSSKTHNEGNLPQKIKIEANNSEKSGRYRHRNFCPFKLMREFLSIRTEYTDNEEPMMAHL